MTEFPINLPTASFDAARQLTDIVRGPDGAMWFLVQAMSPGPPGEVGRVTTAGVVSVYALPHGHQPIGLQVGSDGNLWARVTAFDQSSLPNRGIPGYAPTATVVRVTPSGQLTELNENDAAFAGYSRVRNGFRWWMTATGDLRVISPQGETHLYTVGDNLGCWGAYRVVLGPDGNAWLSDCQSLVRVASTGAVSRFNAAGSNANITWVSAGNDGRVWFAEGNSGRATVGALGPATL